MLFKGSSFCISVSECVRDLIIEYCSRFQLDPRNFHPAPVCHRYLHALINVYAYIQGRIIAGSIISMCYLRVGVPGCFSRANFPFKNFVTTTNALNIDLMNQQLMCNKRT